MMKKTVKFLTLGLCVALGAVALTACGEKKGGGNGDPPVASGYARVSFMDGTNRISYSDVEIGGKVDKPTTNPTKDGYEFVRWCATPNYSIAFDFDAEIDESTSAYAGYRSTAPDDHTWYLAGKSLSDLFKNSGDYKDFVGSKAESMPEEIKMEKVEGKGNYFTITHDFYKGDEFQILNTVEGWDGQLGYGYIAPEQYNTENTANMYGVPNPYDGSTKKANTVIGVSGNYTITLAVDADGKMTEFSYVRNGDAEELPVEFNYFFKGAKISGWQNMLVEYNQFNTDDQVTYTRELSMYAGDEFMFIATQVGDLENKVTDFGGNKITLGEDAKTAAAIERKGNNFTVKGGDGTYAFTLKEDEEGGLTLTAEKKAETFQEFDFYVKGSMDGDKDWEERHVMVKDDKSGKYKFTTEIKKDEKFQLTVTEKGKAPATGVDKDLFSITTASAKASEMSNQIDFTTSKDFIALANDTYTIAIDPVTMIVTVEGVHDVVTWKTSVYGNFVPSWCDAASVDIKSDGDLKGSVTVDLVVGNEFGFRTTKNGSQVGWANMQKGWTGCAGLEKAEGDTNFNVACKVAGKYKFDFVITAEGQITSVTASVVTE